MTGFTGLAYEVIWTRYLSLFMTTSVYAYTTMLTVFLVGLALGSITASRWVDRHPELLTRFGCLQIAVGVSSLALFPFLIVLASSPIWIRLGDPLYSEFALSVVLMIVPAALMGTACPLLSKVIAREVGAASAVVGILYALNNLGAIVGSIMAGFVLIPVLGMQRSLEVLAMVNVAVGLAALAYEPSRRWRRATIAVAATLATVVLVRHTLPHDPARARLQQYVGGAERVIDVREGRMATAWVTEDAWGQRALWGNTSVLGRTRRLYRMDLSAQRLQGHIPLLLHRGNPQNVLGVAFGTGQTFGAQLLHPIRRLDAIDISPEVIELALKHFSRHPDGFHPDSRARIIIADGRSFVELTPNRYDVISLEMPPTGEAGIVHFYTREFYTLARARLAPDGVLAQWLPIYNVTPEETRGIVKTFLAVFPESALWYNGANLLLLGFNGTFVLSRQELRERLQRPEVANDLAVSHLGGAQELLADPKYFLAGFLMGPAGLAALAKDAPIYTDNHPALEFTWHDFAEWGPERGFGLILANMAAIGPRIEEISAYLRDEPGEQAPEIGGIRERYLRRLEAVALDGLGGVALWRGRAADSLELYRQALALSPDFAQAHVNMASLLQRAGQLEAAQAEYERAIGLDARYAEAYYGLGTLAELRRRPADALKSYQRAAEIKEDFRLARARIAALHSRNPVLKSTGQ